MAQVIKKPRSKAMHSRMAETVARKVEDIMTDQQCIMEIGKASSSNHFVAGVSIVVACASSAFAGSWD